MRDAHQQALGALKAATKRSKLWNVERYNAWAEENNKNIASTISTPPAECPAPLKALSDEMARFRQAVKEKAPQLFRNQSEPQTPLLAPMGGQILDVLDRLATSVDGLTARVAATEATVNRIDTNVDVFLRRQRASLIRDHSEDISRISTLEELRDYLLAFRERERRAEVEVDEHGDDLYSVEPSLSGNPVHSGAAAETPPNEETETAVQAGVDDDSNGADDASTSTDQDSLSLVPENTHVAPAAEASGVSAGEQITSESVAGATETPPDPSTRVTVAYAALRIIPPPLALLGSLRKEKYASHLEQHCSYVDRSANAFDINGADLLPNFPSDADVARRCRQVWEQAVDWFIARYGIDAGNGPNVTLERNLLPCCPPNPAEYQAYLDENCTNVEDGEPIDAFSDIIPIQFPSSVAAEPAALQSWNQAVNARAIALSGFAEPNTSGKY